MRQFTQYEFASILVPGIITLAGISSMTNMLKFNSLSDISIGGLGFFVVIAYALGHLIQAFGNMIDKLFWKTCKGRPTDWILKQPDSILSPAQNTNIEKLIQQQFTYQEIKIIDMTQQQWDIVVRQIINAVTNSKLSEKLEIFNCNYALYRGLATSFSILIVVEMLTTFFNHWQMLIIFLFCCFLSLYNMRRFGIYYAQELFTLFIKLYSKTA